MVLVGAEVSVGVGKDVVPTSAPPHATRMALTDARIASLVDVRITLQFKELVLALVAEPDPSIQHEKYICFHNHLVLGEMHGYAQKNY